MSQSLHSPTDKETQCGQRPKAANNPENNSQGERKIDIVIPVMGPTGSGKSTFINYVLGTAQMKVGGQTTACTTQPCPGFIYPIPDFPDLKGYRLVLLDTPGFDDTYRDHTEIVKCITDWLEESCHMGSLVGGVLYLHDISAKRFSGTVRKSLGMFSRLYGDGSMKKTVLVTTNWGSGTDDALERREEELKATHWKVMIDNGAEVHRFIKNSTSVRDIMHSCLRNFEADCSPPRNFQDAAKTDIVIPVMGPTGAGKSTFINFATGRQVAKIGHSPTSCTRYPSPFVIDPIPGFPNLENCRLILLDTPGFDDSHEEDVEILRRIAKWLADSRRRHALVGGVVYLHDMSILRFNGAAQQNLAMFSRLCGDDAMKNTILVTGNWPPDTNKDFEQREEVLKAQHWNTLADKGAQVCRFLRDSQSAWDIINNLLKRVDIHDLLDLQIQTELVLHQMTIPQTEAGKELRYILKQLLKTQNDTFVRTESLVGSGSSEAGPNLESTREKIRKLEDQIQVLTVKLSLPRRLIKLFHLLASLS